MNNILHLWYWFLFCFQGLSRLKVWRRFGYIFLLGNLGTRLCLHETVLPIPEWRELRLVIFFSMTMNLSSFIIYEKRKFKLELTAKEKDDLKHAFDLLDDKGIGLIEAQDINIVTRALGLEISTANLLKIIRFYDPPKMGKC